MQGSRENLSVSDAGATVLDHAVPAPLEAAWETIRAGLRRDCGARTFDGWLKPAELGAFDGDSGELEIVMPSQFMADWVRSHFGERLALAWRSVLPVVRDVKVVAASDGPRRPRCCASSSAATDPRGNSDRSAEHCRTRPVGAQFRPALPLRHIRRRQGQRGCGDGGQDSCDR